jgi:WD40 repeat protein
MSAISVQKLHTITGHKDCIYTLTPFESTHQFFSASGDGMIVMWDLLQPENGQLIATLPNSIYALSFNPTVHLLVAGHNYEGIHLLNVENKKEEGSLHLTKAAIFDIQSLDEYLFVATGEGMVLKIDARSLTIKNKNQSSDRSARCIAVNSKAGEIAVGYSDHKVRLFDMDLNIKLVIDAHDNSVFTVRYSPDGKYLVTGSRDARLKFWNVASGYEKAAEIVAHLYAINHLDYSPDAKHFVTCSLDKTVKVWDAEELKLLKVIDRARHGGHVTSVNKVLWTSYQGQILSASDDRTISVWHLIF